MKPQDHVLREVVNDLRDIALKFHDADQLRERLRAAMEPLLAARLVVAGERVQPLTAPWSVVVEGQTVTLNYSFAAAVLGALFNGSSINAPAFERIKQGFAAIMRGEKSVSQDAIDAACYEVALTDEDIVTVLHSLSIDTFPSAYGFAETQVSGTNVPSIRRIVARCNRIIADKEQIARSTKESA